METDSVQKDTQENFCIENLEKLLSNKILDVILLFCSRQNVPHLATVEFVTCMKSFTDVFLILFVLNIAFENYTKTILSQYLLRLFLSGARIENEITTRCYQNYI